MYYKHTKYYFFKVSMNSAIGLIKKSLEMGANITEVYVDTVGPPEKYQMKLSEIFPDIKITVSIFLFFKRFDNFNLF